MTEYFDCLNVVEVSRYSYQMSRLLTHTASSVGKCTVRPTVVPRPSEVFLDSRDAPSASRSPARSNSPGAGGKRELHNRIFHSSAVLSCLRGSTDNGSGGIVRGGDAIAPQVGDGNGHAGRLVRRPQKNVGTAGAVLPTGNPGDGKVRGLWISSAAVDGQHFTQPKRRISVDEIVTRRTESPARSGRKAVPSANESHIVGIGCRVTSSPRAASAHRIERYHKSTPPYLTGANDPPSAAARRSPTGQSPSGISNGLLGYGPTGKKRIETPDNNVTAQPDAPAPPEKYTKGPAAVQGKSHTSLDLTNLGQYSKEELHEASWRPSTRHLDGPPKFVPDAPPRHASSPTRGRAHAPQGNGNILAFGGGGGSPAPVVHRGRGAGTYSPMRQR